MINKRKRRKTALLRYFIYSLSPKFKHTLKYENKIGRRNIWTNFIINSQNVTGMKHGKYIRKLHQHFLFEKSSTFLTFVKTLLTQKSRCNMQILTKDGLVPIANNWNQLTLLPSNLIANIQFQLAISYVESY